MKTLAVTTSIIVLLPIMCFGQQRMQNGGRSPPLPPITSPGPSQNSAEPGKPDGPDVKAQTELRGVLDRLSKQAAEVDGMIGHLKDAIKTDPKKIQTEVDSAQRTLATLIDRLDPSRDLGQQIQDLRTAEQTHRKRVEQMTSDEIDETEKTEILKNWSDLEKRTDNTEVAMKNMRSSLQTALGKLTRKRNAISEILMQEQYSAAVQSFQSWVDEMGQTAKSLHQYLGQGEPSS